MGRRKTNAAPSPQPSVTSEYPEASFSPSMMQSPQAGQSLCCSPFLRGCCLPSGPAQLPPPTWPCACRPAALPPTLRTAGPPLGSALFFSCRAISPPSVTILILTTHHPTQHDALKPANKPKTLCGNLLFFKKLWRELIINSQHFTLGSHCVTQEVHIIPLVELLRARGSPVETRF